jgi:hypothetical protein
MGDVGKQNIETFGIGMPRGASSSAIMSRSA